MHDHEHPHSHEHDQIIPDPSITEPVMKTDTVYYTPSGEFVVPGEDIPIPEEMIATHDSNFAPLWLVFPKHIFNTHQITCIKNTDQGLEISSVDGNMQRVDVSDLDETWEALQNVFTTGLKGE
jgi:hypothetical protein